MVPGQTEVPLLWRAGDLWSLICSIIIYFCDFSFLWGLAMELLFHGGAFHNFGPSDCQIWPIFLILGPFVLPLFYKLGWEIPTFSNCLVNNLSLSRRKTPFQQISPAISTPVNFTDKRNVQRISRKWQVFKNLFVHLSRKVFTFISVLHKIFLLCYCLIVWWWLQMKGQLLANVSNRK